MVHLLWGLLGILKRIREVIENFEGDCGLRQLSRIWLSLALLLLVFSRNAAFARGTLEGSEILRECRKILMVDKELDKLISSAAAALVAGKISALELSRCMEEIIPRLNDLEEIAVSQVDRYPDSSIGIDLRALLLKTIWSQQARVNALLKAAQIESTLGLEKAKPYYASQIKALNTYKADQKKAHKAFFLDKI